MGLLGAKKSADAAKQQSQTISPLIQAQADTANFNRQQAAIDLPKARATLGSSLDFWNTILKGDRNATMGMIGPSADQQAQQTAAANRNLQENAGRGGRRTLMLGDQPIAAMTDLNRNILTLRAGAPDKQTQIGQILAQMGMGETSGSTAAGGSAISGALGAADLANKSSALTADGMRTFGQSLGQMLIELQRFKYPGTVSASSHPVPYTVPPPNSSFTSLPNNSGIPWTAPPP